MPIYEYQCQSCQKVFEFMQRMSDDPKTECEECKGALERIISQSAFHLKGGGWYKDLYSSTKKDDSGSSDSSDGSASSSSSSESSSASSSESSTSSTASKAGSSDAKASASSTSENKSSAAATTSPKSTSTGSKD